MGARGRCWQETQLLPDRINRENLLDGINREGILQPAREEILLKTKQCIFSVSPCVWGLAPQWEADVQWGDQGSLRPAGGAGGSADGTPAAAHRGASLGPTATGSGEAGSRMLIKTGSCLQGQHRKHPPRRPSPAHTVSELVSCGRRASGAGERVVWFFRSRCGARVGGGGEPKDCGRGCGRGRTSWGGRAPRRCRPPFPG